MSRGRSGSRLDATPKELREALTRYRDVVAGQGVSKLAELDRWYHDELPAAIAARRRPHVTSPELVRLTEWKMARGVWRAPNLVLVRSNPPDAVAGTSAEALALMPHPTKPIALLAKELKGVGPATASAVVAAVRPDVYPFFDELVAEQLPDLGPVSWTLGYYARYAEALREAVASLGGEWTPASLEQALWARVGGKAKVV
jgi:hypothetical protein